MKDEYETKEKVIEKTLAHERSLLYLLMDNIPDWIFFKDTKSRFTRVNRAHAQLLGLADPKEAVGKTDFDFFSRNDAQRFYEEEQKIIRTGQPIVARVGQTPNRDGKILWVSETKMPLHDETGKVVGLVGISRNITELKRSQKALVQERDLLQALIDNIPDSIYFKDDKNRFVRVNKAKAEHSGTTPESMIGKTDFDYFPKEQAKQALADDNRVIKSNRPLVDKVEKITNANGTEHWFSVTKIPRHNEKGEVIGTMGISRDTTQRKQQEKHLAYMATHDILTGLANRALFSDHLTLALGRAQRNRQKFPIMLLDLDNFKDVNDRLGHSSGDKLLQAVGDRLNGILRKADTVARMGGDEFLLLLPEITKTEDIDVVAQKILAAFQRPFLLGDHEVSTTTSIGIAIYPRDGKDADSLIKNADIAMYYAKEKGRNNYQYYTAIMEGKTAG